MDERRENNRIDAYNVGLQVSDSVEGQPIGIVGNLSAGGMMLISRRQLHANGVLQLALDTPTGLEGSPIPVGAKVLWCTPANSPDEFWAGLEIIDIAEADQDSLIRLLEYLASNS